jgi:exopolysaccharide biosynthesis WecB/TagA/CpsF family protein
MQFIDNADVKDPMIRSLSMFDEDFTYDFLNVISQTGKPISLGFVNQYAYNLCCQYENIANDFYALTYRLRDGSGINLACKFNHCNAGANLNGTDFIPLLLKHIVAIHKDAQVFVFGTQEPWLKKGSQKLLNGHSFIAVDGFKDDEVYLGAITKANMITPSLTVVLLAMGMPKQERIAKKMLAALDGPVVVVCGGAIVDFYAGRFSRAPQIFRRFGMEWFYRLSLEPRRLFGRYIIGMPVFFYNIFKNKM